MLSAVLRFVSVVSVTSSLASGLSAEEEVRVARCAKKGQLYSLLDSSCHPPLSPGPCPRNHRLVLDTVTLLGECQARRCGEGEEDMVWDEALQNCVDIYHRQGCEGRGERYLFSMTGGEMCGCEAGWRRSEDGRCSQAGTRADCPPGQILQQTDLPPNCDCRHWTECETFVQDVNLLNTIRESAGGSSYQTGVERLASLVCDKEAEKVCCGQNQRLTSDLGARELVETLNNFYQRSVECETKRCPPGQISWPDRPGQCFNTTFNLRSRSNCRLRLTEEEEVVCDNKVSESLSLRNVPGAFTSKCGRGRIWSRYRAKCVGLFF